MKERKKCMVCLLCGCNHGPVDGGKDAKGHEEPKEDHPASVVPLSGKVWGELDHHGIHKETHNGTKVELLDGLWGVGSERERERNE